MGFRYSGKGCFSNSQDRVQHHGTSKNYASGVFFATANGHMPRAGDIFDSFQVASGKMARMRDQEFNDFYELAMRNGLLEDRCL